MSGYGPKFPQSIVRLARNMLLLYMLLGVFLFAGICCTCKLSRLTFYWQFILNLNCYDVTYLVRQACLGSRAGRCSKAN